MTILEQFKGHEQEDLRSKYPETQIDELSLNGYANGMTNGTNGHSESFETKVDAIVIGAGQSGICTASYLQASGISYVLLERNEKVGDNWTMRYDCLKVSLSFVSKSVVTEAYILSNGKVAHTAQV